MTGNAIPPPDLDLLARRAKVERETADSAEAQTLMDPIFPAMLACSGYLDSLGLIWGEEYELLAQNLVAVLDFASNTFSIKLGAAELPAVDPNGRALPGHARRGDARLCRFHPPLWPDLGSGAARAGRHHRLRLRPVLRRYHAPRRRPRSGFRHGRSVARHCGVIATCPTMEECALSVNIKKSRDTRISHPRAGAGAGQPCLLIPVSARSFGVSRPRLPSPTGPGIEVAPEASALFRLAQCPVNAYLRDSLTRKARKTMEKSHLALVAPTTVYGTVRSQPPRRQA